VRQCRPCRLSDFSVVRGAGGDGVCRPSPTAWRAERSAHAQPAAAVSKPTGRAAGRRLVLGCRWCRSEGCRPVSRAQDHQDHEQAGDAEKGDVLAETIYDSADGVHCEIICSAD
jgi:hypothetical protein